MIDSIQLQSFQAHSRLAIKLDPHITVIIGPSDVGKSSIIRAINYVAFNSPSGMAFIREGSKQCCVTVRTNGRVIKRVRGKGSKPNCYSIDGKRLEALRKGEVPDDILAALRLDELNFQHQHDSPLWLSESAGQVAKNLNEIVNLDLIDRVLTSLSRRTRQVSTELTISQDRWAQAKSDCDSLEWINDATSEHDKLIALEQSIAKQRTEHVKLLAAYKSAEAAVRKADRLESMIVPLKQELSNLQLAAYELKDVTDRYAQLKQLIQEIVCADKHIATVSQEIAQTKNKLQSVKVCPLCEKPL